jgi:CNP1-like family protein
LTRTRAVCALALIAVAAACAGRPEPPPDDGLAGRPWDVQKGLLPPYPKRGDLIPIYVGSTRPFAYSVDRSSVSVGPDGIVRYTLVARSPSGAMNVSYEGLRCQSYESRVYAFGRDDGNWVQARNVQWSKYSRYGTDLHIILADDFFCSVDGTKTGEEAVQALVRGNGPR